MISNFEKSLELVLAHEGGFVNHSKDPGGATMKGVTLAVYQASFGKNRTADDLRKITHEELHTIYRKGYWTLCKCDELPHGLDYALFDFAVNSGSSRAIKYIQEIAGVVADGRLGPQTISAIRILPTQNLITKLCDKRMFFLKSLDTFKTFGKGWEKRVADVREKALGMAK